MTQIFKIAPITFPHTFCADNAYRWGMAAFSILGCGFLAWEYQHHDYADMAKIAGVTGAFLVLLVTVLTFRVRVDEQGFVQSWLLGKRTVLWDTITRMDKTARSVSIYDANGKDLLALSLLSLPAQKAITAEVIERTGLRPSSRKFTYPVLEQWTRS